MLLPGTHRLVDRYRESLPAPVGAGKENWLAFMRHHPWLARLLDGGDLPHHRRHLRLGEPGRLTHLSQLMPPDPAKILGTNRRALLPRLVAGQPRLPAASARWSIASMTRFAVVGSDSHTARNHSSTGASSTTSHICAL